MRVSYHPDFPKDIKRFAAQYLEISDSLALRFRVEVDAAKERIKESPGSAGHFINTGSRIVKEGGISRHFHFSSCMVFLMTCSCFAR